MEVVVGVAFEVSDERGQLCSFRKFLGTKARWESLASFRLTERAK